MRLRMLFSGGKSPVLTARKFSLSTQMSMLLFTHNATNKAMNSSTHPFRIVRDAGEPLGLFVRVGKSDHTVLKQLLSENRVGMLGAG